jgi:hypothetical protein
MFPMTGSGRARAPRVAIPLLAVVAAAVSGCGGGQGEDFERAKSGALKTPSEIRAEALGKSGKTRSNADAKKQAPK